MVFLSACFSLLVTMLTPGTDATSAHYKQLGLTALPNDIPSDTTDLDLYMNSITSVDPFPFFPDLEKLVLSTNLLTAFPEVCAVNLTLVHLNVRANQITTVDPDRLSCLQNLDYLRLSSNYLTSFPAVYLAKIVTLNLSYNRLASVPPLEYINPSLNELFFQINPIPAESVVSGLGGMTLNISKAFLEGYSLQDEDWSGVGGLGETLARMMRHTSRHYMNYWRNSFTRIPDLTFVHRTLYYLSLSDNPVTTILLTEISPLTALETFVCSGCLLTSLPNLCRLNTGAGMLFKMQNNPLDCGDYRNEWMVAMWAAGILQLDTEGACALPSNMAEISTADLRVTTFRENKGRKHVLKVVSQNLDQFQCQSVLRVIKVSDLSLVGCATECVTSSECLAIDYRTDQSQKCKFLGISSEGQVEIIQNLYILN